MLLRFKKNRLLIADGNQYSRRLAGEVLRGAGFEHVEFAADGDDLLDMAHMATPDLVITASRIAKLSGLEFARLVRSGQTQMPRTMPIIVMTDTPTRVFVSAALASGVDEMMALPFAPRALLDRVEAVFVRPRRFIESRVYVGPCRRRRKVDLYAGPRRRLTDPIEAAPQLPWEQSSNRAIIRGQLDQLSRQASTMDPNDRRDIQLLNAKVLDFSALADSLRDETLSAAGISMRRYIEGIGASEDFDMEVVRMHIDAMLQIYALPSNKGRERDMLQKGLVAVVDKRLCRLTARARKTRAEVLAAG
jgi:DNA-binding response OmpR family regulator